MATKNGSSFGFKYSAPLAKRKFNFSELEESAPKEIDSIKVYLRVKPHDGRQINESNDVFEVTDSNTLLVKATEGSKKVSRGNEEYSYTFTHIFPPDVSQKEVFEKSVKESVVDFVNGFSSLIFTYGTTNAGKTFTVQGTSQQPGLIPRAFCLVFKSIEDRQTDAMEYMPCGRIVKRMTEQELKNHSELKQTILNHCNIDDSQSSTKNVHKLSQHESGLNFEIMDMILEKERDCLVVLKPESTYSLWISFYEIYNECIYDLLTAPLTSNSQRKHLKIGEDSAKNSFVRDLNYVNVTSITDARKVLIYGRNNLQVAMTGLNAQSSRSHCIFTLTLVRSPEVAETGDDIVISQLSLCDLAGTERQKKTMNVGERLKESQHINCSLHVLSRCFDIIRENQNRAERNVIPYRESKLTKLFQKALRGEEKIVMMVNINLAFSLDDTHQVLKTSAIARKTTTSIKPWQQKKRRSRSVMLHRSIVEHSRGIKSTLTRSTLTEVDAEEDIDDSENVDVTNVHDQSKQIVESLLATIDTQKKKIASYKNRVDELEEINGDLEDDLRQELAVEYGKLIKTIEDRLKQRIEDKEKVIEEQDRVIAKLESRVNCELDAEAGPGQSARKKRKVFDCSLSMIEAVDDANSSQVEDDLAILREENNLLKNDLSSIKSNLAHYKNENVELNKKYAEIKLMRRIENIATLKEAVLDEDILRILDEMDKMKEKFEAEVSKRNALIKEAMDEMKYLEADYNELRTENGKLEGDLLVARDELEDAKRSLDIANQISAKKSEENHELELKLEQLETDNEKLNDYIELAQAEIKCLQEKLMLLERNRIQSVDIFDNSNSNSNGIVMDEQSTDRAELDDNSHNTLCKQLQKVSLELGTPGVADEHLVSMEPNCTFDALSMNLSKEQTAQNSLQSTFINETVPKNVSVPMPQNCTFDALSMNLSKEQTVQNSLQSTFTNETVPKNVSVPMQQNCTFDALSINLSKEQTVQNSLQSTFTNKTVPENISNSLSVSKRQFSKSLAPNVKLSDKLMTSKSKSFGNSSQSKSFCKGNKNFEVDEIDDDDDGLSTRCEAERDEEEMNQEKENEKKEIEQKIIELTNEIEKLKQNNHSLLHVVEQYKEEKINLEFKIVDLTEEIERLKDENEVPKSQFNRKLTELSLEINEIKTFHSKTVDLIDDFKKEKALFVKAIEKLNVVKEMQAEEIERLREVIDVKNVELEQRKSALESNQERLSNSEKVISEMEEMASTLKTSNSQLITCNRELADKNEQLVKQLESKDEAYESLAHKLSDSEAKHESLLNLIETRECRIREYAEENKQLIEQRENLLQKLNELQINHDQLMKELQLKSETDDSQFQKLKNLEANNERLVIEVGNLNRSKEEYVGKNHQLVEELKSKNEKYESILQKLNNLKAKHECFMKEMDTKESNLRQVENELMTARKDLELKNDEIQKLQTLSQTCKSDSTNEKPRISSNSKVKTTDHSDGDVDDGFISPPHRESNRPAANTTKSGRPARIARTKIDDSAQMKTLTSSARKTKRVTRSAASTQAHSASSSPPHAQILKNLQSDMNMTSPAVSGSRRLLAQPNAMPQISMEEFPDEPQMDSESPVSILNRLTGTPAPDRKLRTRRKKQF